jgi:hypothetical protein
VPADHQIRRRRLVALLAVAGLGAAVVLAIPKLSSSDATPRTPAIPAGGRAPGVTTTTTTDPGVLPQTDQLPTGDDARFQQRVDALWRAVVDDQPQEAKASFFPLSAYIQVKAISDPVDDYQGRLIADFDQDIRTLHAALGPDAGAATFSGVTVPAAAEWIVPGTEHNKASYWRVYGTRVAYAIAGTVRSFPITSLISWRGEWYVVHLGSIR